jgi:hypothetical protein
LIIKIPFQHKTKKHSGLCNYKQDDYNFQQATSEVKTSDPNSILPNDMNSKRKLTTRQPTKPAHMPSTFSFLQNHFAKFRTAFKQKRKRACHFPLLQQLNSIANFRLTEDLATHNSTLVKWRGSQLICKSQFHS